MTALPDAEWRQGPGLARIVAALAADGGAVKVVGGAVRDTLLGLPVTDIDLATPLRPDEVMRRLETADVKVIPKAVLDRVDSLSSPRLVEYWEQDPCPPPVPEPKYEPSMVQNMPPPSRAPMAVDVATSSRGGYEKRSEAKPRPLVPPKLASFAVNPQTVTAGVATPLTWTYSFANEPWPRPTCTVDHGVGQVWPGARKPITLDASSNLKLTCANAAGRDTLGRLRDGVVQRGLAIRYDARDRVFDGAGVGRERLQRLQVHVEAEHRGLIGLTGQIQRAQ